MTTSSDFLTIGKGLVDPDSITVQLTPIGCRQSLYYEEVEWCETIKVVNADCGPVWCSYTVFVRGKIEKNVPEYRGLTPLDYPGDNDEYRLNDEWVRFMSISLDSLSGEC